MKHRLQQDFVHAMVTMVIKISCQIGAIIAKKLLKFKVHLHILRDFECFSYRKKKILEGTH